ncbi:MAG: AGE family epimerase/isomerase [Candidatus Heimdallarchaeota archaeon]|nr:MAG: AGE family epimerase/isomerase [Candidatus Heimdallarchaeota archaeon]
MAKGKINAKTKRWAKNLFLPIIVLAVILPNFMDVTGRQSSVVERDSKKLSSSLDELYTRSLIPLKANVQVEDDPEAYFPNFLYYSIEIANALIDYLYNNVSGGFSISRDEVWSESSLNNDTRTYDNAQAILALLKLSDAVINETERNFAQKVAEKTGNYLVNTLYDKQFDGFYIRRLNRLKKPGVQAIAIQALLSLYGVTGNDTYHEIAIDTFNFLDKYAWKNIDDQNGYYVYLLSHSGLIASLNTDSNDPYEPESKRVDHNVLMGRALLDLYTLKGDESYLLNAQKIYNFFNTTCRNSSTGLFYTGLSKQNEVVDSGTADVFINALVLQFLAHLYSATTDEILKQKYYDDFFILLKAVLLNFWDNRYGGFFATYSYNNPESRDTKKYTERQFYCIQALDEAYKLTNNSLFYNLILDTIEFLNNKLYDNDHIGYYQLTNNDGTPGDPAWNNKYSITQSLAVFSLANLWLYSKPGVLNAVWSPSTPRSKDIDFIGDPVTILVAAFDSDGISRVMINYSINNGDYQLGNMIPLSHVGNMFNFSFDAQPHETTINFQIIVNDTLGNEIVRGSYFFLWQRDEWAPYILEIGIDPASEVPVNSNFSINVIAQDVPLQGEVEFVRMYYHLPGEVQKSIALEKIGDYLWTVTFPEGLPEPGIYAYYFEAIDNWGNFAYSPANYMEILGHLETIPMSFVIGILFVVLILVPLGLYTYVEYKGRSARKTLKSMKRTHNVKRKRGTRRNT